ncbi:MAG: hypothetical protein JXQ90_21860 [Cyclobacteriaceae bacterium]
MKKLIMPILLSMTITWISCHNDCPESYTLDHNIVNESGVPVEIFVYSEGQIDTQFVLGNDESHNTTASCWVQNYCDIRCENDWENYVDSVLLVFNSEKRSLHCNQRFDCFSSIPNIVHSPDAHNYELEIDGEIHTMTYFIT